MKIARTSDEQFVISAGGSQLELTKLQFEDIYYALPLKPSSLYMLLNETLLDTSEERERLENIVEAEGGVDKSMKKLAAVVEKTDPEETAVGEERSSSDQNHQT